MATVDSVSVQKPNANLVTINEKVEEKRTKDEQVEVLPSATLEDTDKKIEDIDKKISDCNEQLVSLQESISRLESDYSLGNKLLILPFVGGLIGTILLTGVFSANIIGGKFFPKLSKLGRGSLVLGALATGVGTIAGLSKLGDKMDNNNKKEVQEKHGTEIKELMRQKKEIEDLRKSYLEQRELINQRNIVT